jgi:hypothetical protein
MPTSLPTESTTDEGVDTFGMGTYDSPESGQTKGGNANTPSKKHSLPDSGGPFDPFGPDRLLSYPTSLASVDNGWFSYSSSAMLPSDLDYPPQAVKSQKSHYDSVVHSEAEESKLPDGDHDNHMADYADRMSIGFTHDSYWGSDGSESYASEESLPSAVENSTKTNNGLGALGNADSGYILEDQNVPKGFPSEDYMENRSFPKSHPGNMVASRIATNVELVRDITKKFVQKHGKKDLTKRHVLSFLTGNGYYSFMSSDVIRCLKLDHDVHVPDVLDVFPVRKASSSIDASRLVALRDFCVLNEMNNHMFPAVAAEYRQAAASLNTALAAIERAGV